MAAKVLSLFSWLWSLLAGAPGFGVTRKQRQALGVAALVGLLFVAFKVWKSIHLMSLVQAVETGPDFEAMLAARAFKFRFWATSGLKALTLAEAYFVFSLFDRTAHGKRLLHNAKDEVGIDLDTPPVKAARAAAAAAVFLGFLVTFAILNGRILP